MIFSKDVLKRYSPSYELTPCCLLLRSPIMPYSCRITLTNCIAAYDLSKLHLKDTVAIMHTLLNMFDVVFYGIFCLMFSDTAFSTCLPSQMAAASISAAASGLLGHVWCDEVKLVHRLHHLIKTDVVSYIV